MRGGIVALLSLALGFGVGCLVGASQAPDAPARAAPAEARPPGFPADAGSPVDDSLARAIDDLPVPDVERGTGTITGQVTCADGTPVAGVTVRAVLGPAYGRRRPSGPPPPPDIEEEVRRLVADLRRERLTRVDAVTQEDGRYVLSGLSDGPYRVAAYAEGFRLGRVRGSAASHARPGAVVDFLAEPVAEVEFDVLLPDGTTAADATILLRSGDDTSRHTWRRDDPRIAVPHGQYMCMAEHGDHAYRSDEVPLDAREGAPAPQKVVVRLKGVTGIRGTITFPPEFPFRYASVHAVAFAGEKPSDRALLAPKTSSAWWESRNRRYSALELSPGRYLVGVSLTGSVVASRVVDVRGMETCDFVIDRLDPAMYVVVSVLDPSGKPLSDVSFDTAYRTATTRSSSRGIEVFPRPDGSFVVLNHPTNERGGGTHSVTANSAKYGEKEVSYKAGETTHLEVRFGDPATLDLSLAGFDAGAHLSAVTVVLLPYPCEAEDVFFASEDTAPDVKGRLALGPVEPGEYEVVLRVSVGGETLVAATRRVTLGPGKSALSIPAPRLHSLVVVDPEAKPDQTLALRFEGNRLRSEARAQVDEGGRARFEPLPEGSYQLAREGDASGAMRITIPGPAEIVFKPSPYTALRARIADADGPWGKAGLKDGDLIVAIDGKDLESADGLQRGYAVLVAVEEATVTVLRGGSRIDLTVNGRRLLTEDIEGGYLEWATR